MKIHVRYLLIAAVVSIIFILVLPGSSARITGNKPLKVDQVSGEGALAAPPEADLGVTKSGPDTVAPGSNVTYTITVINIGPDSADNATLTDPLPTSRLTPGSVDDTCEIATFAVVAGVPATQSLARTSATATPPSGEATCPASSYALAPGPVARHSQTPGPVSSAVAAGPTPKPPEMETGVVPQLTDPKSGEPVASLLAVHPDPNAPQK